MLSIIRYGLAVATADHPRRRQLRARRYLSVIGIGLLGVIVLGAGLAVWDLREEAIAHSRQEMANLGIVLTEHTTRSLQAVDLVLQETRAMILTAGVESPEEFQRTMATEDVHRFLADRLRLVPQADAVGLVSADGRLVNSSGGWPPSAFDVVDRDYYVQLHQRESPDVYISAPARDRATGAWSFFLARRVDSPDGVLLGLVVRTIDARSLEDFHRAITLQEGGSVAVLRRDGVMLARYPHVDTMMGQKLAAQSPFYARVAEGGGTYRSPGYVDGIARVVSVHPLHDFPLVIAVSIAEEAVLATWHSQALLILLATFGTVVGFALLFRAQVVHSRLLEQSEAVLRKSEARFRDFALTSSDWFWESDQKHRFTYFSDHIRGFIEDPQLPIGRTRTELAADTLSEPDKWREHFATLDRHQPFRDFVYARKIGEEPERIVSIGGNPFFDESGHFLGYRGTARDITEKVQAERALVEAKAAAEAANVTKSQFLANMSHELRTPLNAILGFSEILENGIAGPLHSRQAEYVGLIRQSGAHLLHVINELLDLSRIDAGKLELHEELIDPRTFVDSCIAIVKDRAEIRLLSLSADIAEDVPSLKADATRLTQIILNLLSNAIKFTELGGSIKLTVRRARSGGVEFAVQDTGCGMTPAEIETALELFGQVDAGLARRHEGTGLGLPLARRLAEIHGGSLTVESEKGRGTTVKIELPPTRTVSPPPASRVITGEAAASTEADTEANPILA
ncbi:MAG: PAS domain S-box protein [Acetobacteraceae bacterium]|nr:PAS domain S-box protein [Acetobacteraceae bacterium]